MDAPRTRQGHTLTLSDTTVAGVSWTENLTLVTDRRHLRCRSSRFIRCREEPHERIPRAPLLHWKPDFAIAESGESTHYAATTMVQSRRCLVVGRFGTASRSRRASINLRAMSSASATVRPLRHEAWELVGGSEENTFR